MKKRGRSGSLGDALRQSELQGTRVACHGGARRCDPALGGGSAHKLSRRDSWPPPLEQAGLRLIKQLRPRHLLCPEPARDGLPAREPLDKVFSCAWLSHEAVLVATKCSQLELMPALDPLQLASDRRSIAWPDAALETVCASPGGVHAVRANPSRTLLATAGVQHLSECVGLFSLPDVKPLACSAQVHRDWLFGLDWLSDDRLVTASRDGSLALWRVNGDKASTAAQEAQQGQEEEEEAKSGPSQRETTPAEGRLQMLDRREHAHGTPMELVPMQRQQRKVRDVRALISLGMASATKFVSISQNAEPLDAVRLWQVAEDRVTLLGVNTDDHESRHALSSTVEPHPGDPSLYCLGHSHNLYVFDIRQSRAAVCARDVPDSEVPLRSIKVRDPYVSCAGASGMVHFYDLRSTAQPVHSFRALQTVFAHEWAPAGEALLLAGGDINVTSRSPFVTLMR